MKEQERVEKGAQFSLNDYLKEVNIIWDSIDVFRNKELKKTKLFKWFGESKLMLQPD